MAKKRKKDLLKDVAALDFEPLEGEFDAKAFNEKAKADMNLAYMAVASLYHTKEKLVQGWRDIPKEMATLADAHARMLCAACASLEPA